MKKFILYSIGVGFFFTNLASSYAHWTDSRDWGMHHHGYSGSHGGSYGGGGSDGGSHGRM